MIDLSKAPEGATHYFFTPGNELFWYKKVGTELLVITPTIGNWSASWNSVEWLNKKATKIPQQLTVTCDNERIIREFIEDCFKHEGDIEESGYMWSLSDAECHIDEYLKPKKELVVPWEWLPDDIVHVSVNKNGIIKGHVNDLFSFSMNLKLDLTDIDLPVTVKRPEVK